MKDTRAFTTGIPNITLENPKYKTLSASAEKHDPEVLREIHRIQPTQLTEALWLPEGTAVFAHNGKIIGIIKNIG